MQATGMLFDPFAKVNETHKGILCSSTGTVQEKLKIGTETRNKKLDNHKQTKNIKKSIRKYQKYENILNNIHKDTGSHSYLAIRLAYKSHPV